MLTYSPSTGSTYSSSQIFQARHGFVLTIIFGIDICVVFD
jgi:hypothetical protein